MPLYAINQAGHTYLEGDFINYSQINTFKMVYDIKNATITRSVDTRYSCYSRSDYKPLNQTYAFTPNQMYSPSASSREPPHITAVYTVLLIICYTSPSASSRKPPKTTASVRTGQQHRGGRETY